MTQTIYFGTTCPKAGFGEAPQQAFLRPTRDAKIASVATLALLAVSAYLRRSANAGGRVIVCFLPSRLYFTRDLTAEDFYDAQTFLYQQNAAWNDF